jgi:hypothetical protein
MSDAIKNFAKVTASTGYSSGATSIVLTAGNGAKLPTPPFNLVWWDSTSYSDPSDDPNVEIVRVTAISTDTLTISRGQEGTSAGNKSTGGSTYTLIQAPTAKTITDLWVSPTFTGVVTTANGSVSAPAINLGDAATGFFRAALNALAIAINGVQKWTLNATGLGIGTETNPQAPLVISANSATGLPIASGAGVAMMSADGVANILEMDEYGVGGGINNNILFRATRGTGASPSNLSSGDIIGQFGARPFTNGSFFASNTARIAFLYNDSSPNAGTKVRFSTTKAGATTLATALEVAAGVCVNGTNDPGAGAVQLTAQTVASLTAASAAMQGAIASVSDGSAALAWGATVTGGGATPYLVYCNGTNWTVAGK